MSECMTPAGVKYVNMYNTCKSQLSICMIPARSSMSVCMTPAGVKNLNV